MCSCRFMYHNNILFSTKTSVPCKCISFGRARVKSHITLYAIRVYNSHNNNIMMSIDRIKIKCHIFPPSKKIPAHMYVSLAYFILTVSEGQRPLRMSVNHFGAGLLQYDEIMYEIWFCRRPRKTDIMVALVFSLSHSHLYYVSLPHTV